MSEEWLKAAKLSDLEEGVAEPFEIAGREVVLVRVKDKVYCLKNCCSHEEYPLSEGEVDTEELTIECAKHGSTFSLEDGEALCLPATTPVEVYEVKVEGDEVFVRLGGA